MAEKAQDPKTASEVQPHPVNDDSVNGDGSAQAEDNASSFKQEGVARVEGITSAVPRKTLLILFALSVAFSLHFILSSARRPPKPALLT